MSAISLASQIRRTARAESGWLFQSYAQGFVFVVGSRHAKTRRTTQNERRDSGWIAAGLAVEAVGGAGRGFDDWGRLTLSGGERCDQMPSRVSASEVACSSAAWARR